MNAGFLREKLIESIKDYCGHENISGEKESKTGVILFHDDLQQYNFFGPSYQHILNTPEWKKRLMKELDSCMSSDALLMNIFCNPRMQRLSGVKKLLHLDTMNDIIIIN